ncbi:hypothetical protein HDU97_008424 [Phlyctochytrium planicorne]|nr:hypothetical protein HDU97_008424 [Phlyctochytrium planicorne]
MRSRATEIVRAGMQAFTNGQLQQSLKFFDEAAVLCPEMEDELWQRGLTLFYMGNYGKAAHQFRIDVKKNPNDTEESIWCQLCESKLEEYGVAEARKRLMKVGRDSRDVMRLAYEMFAGRASEQEVLSLESTSPSAAFYGNLYVGLHAEMLDNEAKARNFILKALATPHNRNDYMYSLARIHCQVRGWSE